MILKKLTSLFIIVFLVLINSCADGEPFLSGFIKRASDAVLISCDPYGKGETHTCLAVARAFNPEILIYLAGSREMMLSDMQYFPHKIKVGPATDELSTPTKNLSAQLPYFFALDKGIPSLFIIRAFDDEKKTNRSFQTPEKIPLEKRYDKIVSFAQDNHIFVVLLSKGDNEILMMALNKSSGELDTKYPSKILKLGSSLSDLTIDDSRSHIAISDSNQKKIYYLTAKDIKESLVINKTLAFKTINTDILIDKIFVEERVMNDIKKTLALTFEFGGKGVSLVDLSNDVVLTTSSLPQKPASVYFPDINASDCCGDKKHWFAYVDNKGLFVYENFMKEDGTFIFEENVQKNLNTSKDLGVRNIIVKKIIGGKVLPDPKGKRKEVCTSRQMFLITSFARDPYSGQEIEGHSRVCEGQIDPFVRIDVN